jgi:hypothetical protein
MDKIRRIYGNYRTLDIDRGVPAPLRGGIFRRMAHHSRTFYLELPMRGNMGVYPLRNAHFVLANYQVFN